MISQDIAQLVIEIVEQTDRSIGEQWKREAKENPEVFLVALLERIKARMPEQSAMLASTVDSVFFPIYQEEAREFLKR